MKRTLKKGKWSEKEVKFLKENYISMTNRKLAEGLGRSLDSVERKLYRLDLKKTLEQKESLENAVTKEKQKIREKTDKQLLKKLIGQKASLEIITDILKEVVPKAKYKPHRFKHIPGDRKEEIMGLNLGDIHIGRYPADLLFKKAETLYDAVLKLAKIHRSAYPVNHLVINMLGDIVDGDGIFPSQPFEQKFFLMEQMFTYGAPMLVDLFNRLSDHFESITINTVPGNHGRKSKWTTKELNFDSMFYEYLRKATEGNKKIKWNINWNWYQVVDIFGWNFFLTHGANIRTWMNLPFYGMKEKGMRWKGSLPKDFDYFMMGHFHTMLSFKWNDFTAYISGTWLDNDRFALEILGMKSSTTQMVFGVSKKRGITWKYDVQLNGK